MSTKPHPWPFPTPDANVVPPTADDLRWLADLGTVLVDSLEPPVSDELVAYCLEWARRQELERAIVGALADAQELEPVAYTNVTADDWVMTERAGGAQELEP